MYINKGIYTYIPNPDGPMARTPNPELVFQGTGEQLFGLFFRQCEKPSEVMISI
jgi:hypothetical protein